MICILRIYDTYYSYLTGLCTSHNHDNSEGYENYLYNNGRIPFRPNPSQLERFEHEQKRLENTKKYMEQNQIKDDSLKGNGF